MASTNRSSDMPVQGVWTRRTSFVQLVEKPRNLSAGRKEEVFLAHVDRPIPASPDIDSTQPAAMPLPKVCNSNGLVHLNRSDDILMEPIQEVQLDVIHFLRVGNTKLVSQHAGRRNPARTVPPRCRSCRNDQLMPLATFRIRVFVSCLCNLGSRVYTQEARP